MCKVTLCRSQGQLSLLLAPVQAQWSGPGAPSPSLVVSAHVFSPVPSGPVSRLSLGKQSPKKSLEAQQGQAPLGRSYLNLEEHLGELSLQREAQVFFTPGRGTGTSVYTAISESTQCLEPGLEWNGQFRSTLGPENPQPLVAVPRVGQPHARLMHGRGTTAFSRVTVKQAELPTVEQDPMGPEPPAGWHMCWPRLHPVASAQLCGSGLGWEPCPALTTVAGSPFSPGSQGEKKNKQTPLHL